MENFVLYEEVGRGDHSIIYKGRRKGTINFVAIHCIDKTKRAQITNLVRLTHEISHPNVVKFHEWYETSNHLWLVMELCTGGSLQTVITQDGHLPESSIRTFGIDIIQGLHHIHSLGMIFSDLKPSKLLLDGPGILKYAGFGLSRVEGENLTELFEQFADSREHWGSEVAEDETDPDVPKKLKTLGCPTYLAPEIIENVEPSIASDLWSMGCVLYEMYTGHPPFSDDNIQELMDKITNSEIPPIRVKGSRVSGKASPDFQNLLEGLLKKNPAERLGWHGLVTHPFWKGQVQHLTKELETSTEVRQSIRQSMHGSLRQSVNNSLRESVSDLARANSVYGQVHVTEIDTGRSQNVDRTDGHAGNMGTLGMTERPESVLSDFRPKTAPDGGDASVNFTLSSRPFTAGTPVPGDEHLSPQKVMTQSPINVKDTIRKAKHDGSDEKVNQLIYHTSDFTVTSIVDNPKIQKSHPLKYDTKTLAVPPYSAEKVLALPARDQEKHLTALVEALSGAEKGPPSQRRINLFYYAGTVASQAPLANQMVRLGILNVLSKCFKDMSAVEMRAKLGRIMGLIANNTTELDETTNLSEVMSNLNEVMRDNFRNTKVKVVTLPAVGEMLYLIASQEEIKGHAVEAWSVASVTYTLIIRCLREGEDALVNHYAAKIVENVGSTTTQHAQKLAVNEVGQLLWYVFSHATADSLRITALLPMQTRLLMEYRLDSDSYLRFYSIQELGYNTRVTSLKGKFIKSTTFFIALARLTKHSVNVFQNVIEKVGLPKILSTMALPIPRIQQAVITMFASLIISEMRLTRLIQDKDFVQNIMRLLESPSMVIRGKAFLVILELIKNNQEMLLVCCHSRICSEYDRSHPKFMVTESNHKFVSYKLVMYIERDSRKQSTGKLENHMQFDYLSKCLEWLVSTLVELVPAILKDILSALDAVSGRKHPSTIQVKQLKISLPMMPVIQHFISSQVFRPRIVNETFIKNIGSFLAHVRSIDAGATQIQAATGPAGTEDFIHTVFSVLEVIAQHPTILTDYHHIVIDKILPPLANLVSSSAGDTRALSLRLFSEMASIFLNQATFDAASHKAENHKIHQIIADALLPQYEQILLEQDPLPSHGLKLLLALLEQNSAFIRQFEKLGLTPVLFQVLVDHQNNPVSSTMHQLVAVLAILVSHKETNMRDLYEQGLVDQVTNLIVEVTSLCLNTENNSDVKMAISVLQNLLEILHCVLKFVSDIVRKALQAKKARPESSSKEAEYAEHLLLSSKPFTDLVSLLTQLLTYEDSDIADTSLKCLSLLVQLYGGESPDAMSAENMDSYSEALKLADAKKQKVILRIIKRMLSTEKTHVEHMRQDGQNLAKTITNLVQTASSHAEVAVTTLAAEILKTTGFL